ncbi:MAG TPA: methionyl-tRNA formyltransferase [Clostridiales bacterium]|nr:methionyl-tRNA formyltransferase [Clostridiales bacterium]
MGTPDFAVPSLVMLLDAGYDVLACVTQPDRKAGRGHKTVPPPVKKLAEERGVPVYQFEKVSAPEGCEVLEKLAPDVMVTAAFGHILSDRVLAIPKYGCINVHASLLPKLRGAAPIQWAVITGEKKTGVTTMYTVKALDAGDILEQDAIDIPDDMTAGELYDALAALGAQTLKRTLEKLAAGTLCRTPQNEDEATYFPMFKKGFGEIDFCADAKTVVDFVRGTNPMPGAYVTYGDEKIKIHKVSRAAAGEGPCGAALFADAKNGLVIACAGGAVHVDVMQRQGGRAMRSEECLRGKKMDAGYVFRKAGL